MKQVIALSVSLVAALTAAYMTWTDDTEEPTDDAVPLYQASEEDVKKVTYTSETLNVVIERRTDDKGSYLWVDSTETKLPKKKDDPHAEADGEDHAHGEEGEKPPAEGEEPAQGEAPLAPEPAADEPPKVERAVFIANDQGDELWKTLSPLAAMRELEAPKDLSTFGLDQPKGTLVVEHGGGTTELKLGGETYGSKDRYVASGGHVYLVDDAALKPLEFAATRILERNLFPLEEHQIDQVSATTAAGGTLSWKHVNKDDQAKAFWARPDSPDTDDAAGGTWIDKVMRIKVRDYVLEAPTGLVPAAKYTVVGDGKTWEVRLLHTDAEPQKWFAESDFNRTTVSVTDALAKDLVADLEDLANEQ